MGGGSSAPSPDKNVGRAAMMSAQTGREFLDFMRGQSTVSNRWAAEDRARSMDVFRPVEDAYIAANRDAVPDYEGVERDVRSAQADVRQQFSIADDTRRRQMARMGVDPDSGRYQDAGRKSDLTMALAHAGVSNATRLRGRDMAEAEAEQQQLNVINMGKGLAVNPATSLGLSNNAGQAGFSGAMRGYGQQGQLLNADYRNRMAGWEAEQSSNNSLFSGLGSIAGYAMSTGMLSSKDYKEGRKPARDVLEALHEMPVDTYRYKDGIADGGAQQHVGPMAEDFHAATGKGDGRTIPMQDMVGMLTGAVQELDKKVDALSMQGAGTKGKPAPRPKRRDVMEAVA